ncbi:unnamed protein product [Thelazia callipaeda]|uniref:ANK_REP_REGION domain-containing protein n=1 Tax=Thelazia callipaeda TaxID=103827 RepID=A0A0N5CLB4_THECL|nr:unnamed protein product [Thelazia callipaeda]
MISGMVREDSDVALEASHFAFLQQNKNVLGSNVLWRRKEQLEKWETSETNRLPSVRRLNRESKVKFTDADIFLSACLSGDLEEVGTLLDNGADINTTTVDGLTALHQAVIDGKPEMVQFLVDHGANLNAQDNEGWTPLHAAACCGNIDLVEYLCARGADLSVTNSDKELALDLAEEDDCRMVLEEEHHRQSIDPDECRNREILLMRRDAEQWLKDGEIQDNPHFRTGATALHVAAAKGYHDVMQLLLKAGANVNCRDRDGWTPLHAAAHWAEHEAAAILIQNGASFSELTNNVGVFANLVFLLNPGLGSLGETVLNVADKKIIEYLEGMQEQERSRLTSNNSVNVLIHANIPLKRSSSTTSVLRMSTEEKTKKTKLDEQDENKELREGHYSFVIEDKSPSPSVEVRLPFPSKQQLHDNSESSTEEERYLLMKDPHLTLFLKFIIFSTSRTSSEEKTASTFESKNSNTNRNLPSASQSVSLPQFEQGKTKNLPPDDKLSRTTSVPPLPSLTLANELKSSPEGQRNPTSCSSSTTISSSVSRSPSTESNSSTSLAQNHLRIKNHIPDKEFTTTKTTVSLEPSAQSNKTASIHQPAATSVPWMSLYRSSVIKGPLHPAFAHFQAAVRQAATGNKSQAVKNVCTVQATVPSLSRGTLATPPMEPNLPNESEAERRSKAKRQRDSRRSTQGVTREQLRVATTLAVRRNDKEKDKDKENETQVHEKNSSTSPSLESSTSNEVEKKVVEGRKDLETNSYCSLQTLPAVPRTTRRVTGPIRIDGLQADETSDDSVQSSGGDRLSACVTTPSLPSADLSELITATTSYNVRYSDLTSIASTQATLTNKLRPFAQHEDDFYCMLSFVEGILLIAFVSLIIVNLQLSFVSFQTNSVHIGGTKSTTVPLQIQNNRTKCQEIVDYKALYEKEKQETEKLRRRIEELSIEKSNSASKTSYLNRGLEGRLTSSSSLSKSLPSSIDSRERRSYEQRIAEMQYEIEELKKLEKTNASLRLENEALIRVLSKMSRQQSTPTWPRYLFDFQQLEHLRADNQKLKEENGALIRVISKLSK